MEYRATYWAPSSQGGFRKPIHLTARLYPDDIVEVGETDIVSGGYLLLGYSNEESPELVSGVCEIESVLSHPDLRKLRQIKYAHLVV